MIRILIFILTLALLAPAARAEFADEVDLGPLRSLSIQHNQTLKTLDSFARQNLSNISARTRWNGRDALFTVLDISFRPEAYVNVEMIKVRHLPLREDLTRAEGVTDEQAERIMKGYVSHAFIFSQPVMRVLTTLTSQDVKKGEAVNRLYGAATQLDALMMEGMPIYRIIPPATRRPDDHIWHSIVDVGAWGKASQSGATVPELQAYGDRTPLLGDAGAAMLALRDAWQAQDAARVNEQIRKLAEILPKISPEVYPSQARRSTEVVYNRLAKLTIPGAAVYFVAFVLFLMSSRSGVGGLRMWGVRLFILAFLIHTAGIGIRWWLVEKSVGSWFEAIPIKNQFESVLFSAWFGALVGLILELRRSRGIFGAAASFVGWMSLVAIFSVPYVFDKEIGGEIGQVQGVLMSYWLYIHVTLVTASYALIGMSFALGLWWLIRYYRNYGTLKRVPARQLSGDAARDDVPVAITPQEAAVLGFRQTLARALFLPVSKTSSDDGDASAGSGGGVALAGEGRDPNVNFLATLDLCNLVVLQLAFWILGVGIICGAIWADESWGRPWGWDPKETFALVTWIVYLIVVHVDERAGDRRVLRHAV
jgi:ABC-type transport system involved in cytochrome c biogenesis permease subunit